MKRTIRLIVVLSVLAIGATAANAMSVYLYTFNLTYPSAAATLGQDCTLCHVVPGGGGPPNSYGSDFARNGYDFHAIEPLDSDNDGFTNIEEIQALTYPGDPTSHPVNTTFIGTPTSGPVPLTVSFVASTANGWTAWFWDFGDGSTSTEQTPVHTYTTDGSFSVSLTATGTGGAVQTIKNDYINVVGVCSIPPVRIVGQTTFDTSIQDAYNQMGIYSGVMQVQALVFTEDLTLDHQLSVFIQGGYNCEFTSNLVFTTVQGSMTISNGAVTIENVIFQ